MGIAQSSETGCFSENVTVLNDMSALRMEMLVFKVMCQNTLGDRSIFISDLLRRLRCQDSYLPKIDVSTSFGAST